MLDLSARHCVHRRPSLRAGVLRSAIAQKVIDMGLDPSVVERITLEKIRTTGSGYSSVETLLEACLNSTAPSNAAAARDQGTAVLSPRYGDCTEQTWPAVIWMWNIKKIYIYICLNLFQMRTHWRNCRSCRGRNSAKYVWTETFALCSFHAVIW